MTEEFKIACDTGHFGSGNLIKAGKRLLYTRTLANSFVMSPSIEDDLEKLINVKHKYIARMIDYKLVDMGPREPALIMTISHGYIRRLSSYLRSLDETLPTRRYVTWIYQAGKGVSFLLVNGVYHKFLSAQNCLLDDGGNIKLSDFWTHNESVNVAQNDSWRSLPPETLLNNVFTARSLIWTFAHLIWQVFTHCTLRYRSKFDTLSDFVTFGCRDEEFHMPGTVEPSELETSDRNLYYRLVTFEKLCQRFPRAPESFNRFVRKCLESELQARPTWSELLPILNKEHRIYKLSLLAEIFNCSG